MDIRVRASAGKRLEISCGGLIFSRLAWNFCRFFRSKYRLFDGFRGRIAPFIIVLRLNLNAIFRPSAKYLIFS